MKKIIIAIFIIMVALVEVAGEPTNISFEYFINGRDEIYKVSPNSSRGYNIAAYLFVPKYYKYSHLFVYPYKSFNRYEYDELDKSVFLKVKSSKHPVADRLDAVTLWLVLPQDVFEYMRLGMLLNVSGKWNRLDNQIKHLIEDVHSFLESKDIVLSKKIVLSGYSGEGSCCVNFAMLHPEMVHAVAAGGLAWHIIVPRDKIGSIYLNWPLGINDYKQIAGYDFDYESWKNIKFYLDQGLIDDRGIKYGGRLAQAGFPVDNERKLWDIFSSEIIKCSSNVEVVLYTKLGHQYVVDDYVAFLRANEGDEFKPVTPSKEAEVLIGVGPENQ